MSEQGAVHRGIDESTLAALLEASAVMNASLDLGETLQAIARTAADVLQGEASSVLLLDRRRSKLVFRAAVGDRSDLVLGEEFDAGLGIAGQVVGTGQPVLAPDVRVHPSFIGHIDAKSSFTTRGLVAAPLRYRGEVIGVVEVLNKRPGGAFTQRDLDILRVFANLAAIATSNAQMHELLKLENLGLRVAAHRPEAIIGASPALRRVLALCDRVAPTPATVLLLGETGTGKELTARRIHEASPRRSKPFIAIQCAALPETLLESELFGYEAGAFTGAAARKLGRFELADRGTLFLDEIGDIGPTVQVKLLRVLQEKEFVRVGGTQTISCDVRIVAATNRDLKQLTERGAFREDLYYRLNVFPIHLPPLRERREDIPLLVEHFVRRAAEELASHPPVVAPEAMSLLGAYRWPGNIRELRNVIERAVLLCEQGRIEPQHLPREISGAAVPPPSGTDLSPAEGYERAMILRALEDNQWNQVRAARALGMSRDNLRYRLRKYGLKRSPSARSGPPTTGP